MRIYKKISLDIFFNYVPEELSKYELERNGVNLMVWFKYTP